MPKKKKDPGDVNEARWVRVPTQAKPGKRLCDVAYEHRCHAGVTLEVLGVEFVPGQIVTYQSRADVPVELIEHPELQVRDVEFGVCRIDQMFRYTPLSHLAFNALGGSVAVPVPEPEPLPDDAEPEGDE